MARESKSRTIDGVEFTVTQLGARKAREIGTRLVKVLGAGVGSDKPVADLTAALNDDDVQFLVEALAPMTTVAMGDKKPVLEGIMEEFFAGRFGMQMRWLLFALEVNFSSFLSELGINVAAISAHLQTAKSSLISPLAPIGPSGA